MQSGRGGLGTIFPFPALLGALDSEGFLGRGKWGEQIVLVASPSDSLALCEVRSTSSSVLQFLKSCAFVLFFFLTERDTQEKVSKRQREGETKKRPWARSRVLSRG